MLVIQIGRNTLRSNRVRYQYAMAVELSHVLPTDLVQHVGKFIVKPRRLGNKR